MLRKIYLSPLGNLISIALQLVGKLHRPFMVLGYWNKTTCSFQKYTRISSSTLLMHRSNIDISDRCWIGPNSIIDGSNGVKIGEGVQIAGLSGIYSHSSHIAIRLCGKKYIEFEADERSGYVRGSVEIGDYTYIGVAAVVLPGVKIGRGCVIGAGSIVNSNIPNFSIVAGNPGRIIGSTLSMDKEYFDSPIVQADYFDKDVISQWAAESKSTTSITEG
jgi:acetyltransferase-like isoleucine patch superfamily enzyme